MFASIFNRLESVVTEHGNNTAIVSNDGSVYKYKGLWSSINTLSNYIGELKFNKGDRVALILNNSPEFVMAYYAVLSLGGVVVAMNTAAKLMILKIG